MSQGIVSEPVLATPGHATPGHGAASDIVQLSSGKFLLGCLVAALAILLVGPRVTIPNWVMAAEVFATIIALFVFGSIKYQVHKNALTYGAGLIVLATFYAKLGAQQATAALASDFPAVHDLAHVFTLHWIHASFVGLEKLIHIDTMLFILGLTFFVSCIAQTRLLESASFALLRLNRGQVLGTVLAITAVVSVASGILDGVSMVGLTIRTLVIILVLAAAPTKTIRYAVMVCTVVTTVCGMWLAYGEPPNLIMKANVIQHVGGVEKHLLTDGFFLRYCLPAAVVSFACVAVSLVLKLRGLRVNLDKLDILDANVATVRFLHAANYGETITTTEFLERNKELLGGHYDNVMTRRRAGEAMGEALVRENVPAEVRIKMLGDFVKPQLAEKLDRHYVAAVAGDEQEAARSAWSVGEELRAAGHRSSWAQRIGILAMVPFIGLLITHALNHHVPLFFASFAGFLVALAGIWGVPRTRKLALHDAKHEFSEYYFLFPLFLSISLLTKIAFFDQLAALLHGGIESMGVAFMAVAQFFGATFLSALLDNNVVADFAGRAIRELPELSVIYLFAMAQIAGYAAGGCWTHIGSAQSVVAYAFIKRDVDERFTPFQWIKAMTPILLTIFIALTVLILVEALVFHA